MKRLCVLLLFFKVALVGVLLISCEQPPPDLRTKALDPAKAKEMARAVEATVSPQLAQGLVLKLWGVDSLVADPVSIDIDDAGRIYYTRTNRQKDSEFDIRGHQDWEIGSIRIQTIEEKRAFLHQVLAPELSDQNKWLTDVNGDGSHDWRDMTIQKEHVYRVEDVSGDTVADRSQLVIEDFHDEVTDAAGGILKHGPDLFVGIGPDLWRIQEDKYGLAKQKTSISHGYGIHIGFGGHGMSGVEVGPEGKIYWQIGDIGFNGVGPDGQKWEHPNSGVIVRANPDGSDFEVFAYGNRNTHEFVFDEYGNLISEDNDGDHAGESERIVYVVNGADIGWRINWQFGKYRDPNNNTYKVWMDEKMYVPRHEGQAAYFIPTIRNFVNGPTGMLYNPGTALGPEYKNTFLVGEFVGNPTRSGIHAFTLKPKGASFEFGESKPVVMGILATGIDFGPDGALYMADWIEGWGTKDHGRIWRLDVQNPNTQERVQTRALLGGDFTDLDTDELAQHLRHADLRVRQKAQFELAARGNRGMEVFKETLAQKDHQLARVHAIWGISQLARKELKHGAVLVPYLADADPEIRAQAAKWLGDVRYPEAGEALIVLLRDDYPRARFFAAEALGRTAHEPAIQPLVALLASNNDEDHYIRHAASLALARIGKVQPVAALAAHPSRAVRLGAVLALRRMKSADIAGFVQDSDEYIVAEAARAVNDDLSIPDALPALGQVLRETRFTSEPLLRRAINANLRVGTPEAMQLLVDYAQREGAPVAMRAEAIDALSTWAKPSVLDRVDGRYRGEVVRDLSEVQMKAGAVLISLLPHTDPALRQMVARATGRLQLKNAAPALLTRLKVDRDPTVRETALRALVALGTNQTEQAIRLALADQSKNVRVAGLDLLTTAGLTPAVMVPLLAGVIESRTTEEKQAAITTLGSLPVTATQPTFEQLLSKWQKGTLPPEVQLELADAIEATKSAALKDRLLLVSRGNATDSLKALYAGALVGGDAQRGAGIFWGHPTAQCVRCHSFNDYGGTAGPRVNGVGARLTREQLLEALINPSARIAPGFGVVTLELAGGTRVSGLLVEETAETIRIKRGDQPDSTIAKTAVQKRIDSPSSMPTMQYLLSKKELRDVVAFLASLDSDD